MNRMTSNEALNRLENPNSSGTIYKQAAIDAIEKFSCCGYIEEDTDKLLKVINDLPPVQAEQRWIPWDSGRLPEESGTYTVTAFDGVIERVTYAKYQKRLKRWELTGARAYWRVLAWMPLPEPYRKEGEK